MKADTKTLNAPESRSETPSSAGYEPRGDYRGEATVERLPQHTIYKPNSRGSGGVIRFGLNPYKEAMFVDAAPQNGERQFDWEAKLTMKWGLSDLGAVLAVLQGRQSEAKLFHKSEKTGTNSAFELVHRTEEDRPPYLLVLSRQDADKALKKVMVPLTHAEAALLQVVLARAVERLLGW
ncbi:MAG: hypothetical protein MUF31_12645 [Akkermansiaceae bacterium]|jgi:hypothetical protein|nr:hypothetical protein [Akkermansiaceae bacterium]